MEQKISIVMAAYNAEEWIDRAIKSVLSQSYNNWELICIDDGSNDSTAAIIAKYCLQDQRIRAIHQDNQGPASARRAGYKAGLGYWYIMLDSDDFFDENTLALLVKYTTHQNCDAVIADWVSYDRHIEEWVSRNLLKGFEYGQELSGENAFVLTIPWKLHAVALFRNTVIKKFATDEKLAFNSYNADEFVSRRLLLACRNVIIGEGRYYRVDNPTSLTMSSSAPRFKALETNRKLAALALNQELSPQTQWRVYQFCCSGILNNANHLGAGKSGAKPKLVLRELRASVADLSEFRNKLRPKAGRNDATAWKVWIYLMTASYIGRGAASRALFFTQIRNLLRRIPILVSLKRKLAGQ